MRGLYLPIGARRKARQRGAQGRMGMATMGRGCCNRPPIARGRKAGCKILHDIAMGGSLGSRAVAGVAGTVSRISSDNLKLSELMPVKENC